MREIRCKVYLNVPIDGQKTIVRTDTNEILKIEEMEAHEFQEQLPFNQKEDTNPETKETEANTETNSSEPDPDLDPDKEIKSVEMSIVDTE